ncbi:MAG TPA: hypothetical protein VE982_03845 [Gaiellaceae bacterium]|nr:hypothetical protein [Gaiellaceae bacterium]
MSETHEHGRNPTQERIDREGASDAPADAPWETGEGRVDEDAPDYDLTKRERGPSEAS